MRALTFIAPMGQAIILDHPLSKRIENRPRPIPRVMLGKTQIVAVHSGKKWSDEYASTVLAITGITSFATNPMEIIGLMRLTGRQFTSSAEANAVFPGERGRWYGGPFGYEIADAIGLPRPLGIRGAMGWWSVPENVVAEIKDQVPSWFGDT